MIRHVVLLRFAASAGEEEREAFCAAARALPEAIPEIRACTAGPGLGLQAGAFDFALLLDFEDEAAFAAYKLAPAHRRFIAEHMEPHVAEAARAQVAV